MAKPAFDPSQSFQATKPAFDPNAPFEAAPEGPSETESALRGAAQGATFNNADEITGGAQAFWDALKGSDTPFADAYRKHRDESRANFDAAQAANPNAYGAGEIGGGIAAGLAAAPLTGGASLGSSIALGAGTGALNAIGASKELDAQAAQDALTQGVAGGVLGAAGHGVGSLVSRGVNAATEAVAPKAASALEDIAASAGNRAVRGGSTGTANNLTREQILRALERGDIQAGDTVGNIAERSTSRAQAAGETGEKIIKGLDQLGVPPEDAQLLAEKWASRSEQAAKDSLVSPAPGFFKNLSDKIAAKGSLSLEDLTNLKRDIGDPTNWGADHPGALDRARMEAYGDLKDLVESAAAKHAAANPDNAVVQGLAKELGPTNALNGDLIALRNASQRGADLTANRSSIGPTAKLALLHGAATLNPLSIATGLAKHAYDTRGASTVAKAAFNLSKSFGKVGKVALTDPSKLGRYGAVLASAAKRGPDALNATHFVLGQTDPEYQRVVGDLSDDDAPDHLAHGGVAGVSSPRPLPPDPWAKS